MPTNWLGYDGAERRMFLNGNAMRATLSQWTEGIAQIWAECLGVRHQIVPQNRNEIVRVLRKTLLGKVRTNIRCGPRLETKGYKRVSTI